MENTNYNNENDIQREFDISELLSVSWNIFKANYFKIFGLIFTFALPMAILEYFLQSELSPYFMEMSNYSSKIGQVGTVPDMSNLVNHILNGMKYAFVIAILSVLFQIAISRSIYSILYKNEFNFANAISDALRMFIPVFFSMFIFAIAVGFGFLFLLIPGIIILTIFYFTLQICIIERIYFFDAMIMSKEIVKNRFGKTLVTLLTIVILTLIINFTLSIIQDIFNNMATQIIMNFIMHITNVYFIIFGLVFYINFRDTAHLYNPDFSYIDKGE